MATESSITQRCVRGCPQSLVLCVAEHKIKNTDALTAIDKQYCMVGTWKVKKPVRKTHSQIISCSLEQVDCLEPTVEQM